VWLSVTALSLFFAGAWRLTAQGQSLTDVATKEAQRRQTVAQPSKVYTNTDVKPLERDTPVSPAVPVTPPPVPDKSSESSVTEPVVPVEASPPRARTQMEEMNEHAEKLFGPRLAQLDAEGKAKNEEYRSLTAQANSACAGTTDGTTASEGSTFLGYNPLITVNANGIITSVIPNPKFLTTTSFGTVSTDNKTSPLCRSLQAQVGQLVDWARQIRSELDDMETTARHANIYPGIVRSLIAANLPSW
jgi:hypothetical protein